MEFWVMAEFFRGGEAAMKLHTVVKKNQSLLSSQVGDDLVFFSAERGMFYGTKEVGKRIWDLIQGEVSISCICDHLIVEYDVERARCEREVIDFLGKLEAEGLVVLREAHEGGGSE
ncbi:PqqD family peptide modification chaperone [Billgrantia kenyensis]|uniref:PqqD family protein n=1 Tax=Billgrantia kenyensis TaxID=321266 RepID=A0A7V9W3E0_9GAMM|nr:PqqD family peptide modification chaperone [Halomonas kenyensis]MBA2780237.1 PqqD family protein [Halomonas kenyensis]MCG6663107.1 PqqD family protein [Halomonas kenyensis]